MYLKIILVRFVSGVIYISPLMLLVYIIEIQMVGIIDVETASNTARIQ